MDDLQKYTWFVKASKSFQIRCLIKAKLLEI
jgi:hypothetical protein